MGLLKEPCLSTLIITVFFFVFFAELVISWPFYHFSIKHLFPQKKSALSVTLVGMMIMIVLIIHLARCPANNDCEVGGWWRVGLKIGCRGDGATLCFCMCVH